MIENLSPRKRNLALAAVGLVVAWFAWRIRAVVNPLLLGYLMAFIVQPLVARLKQRGLRHGFAVGVVFAGMGVLTILIGLAFFAQSRQLVDDMLSAEREVAEIEQAEADGREPGIEDPPPATMVDRWLGDLKSTAERWFGPQFVPDDLPTSRDLLAGARGYLIESGSAQDAATSAGVSAARILGRLLSRTMDAVFGIGSLVFLVPLYAFFMLFEIDRIHAWVAAHLPLKYRAQLVSVGTKVGEITSNFFRGRVLVAAIKGVILTLSFWFAGVPYPLLVGMTGGILGLLPFIGGIAGFAVGALAASLAYSWFLAIVVAGAIFILAELIEGYVLLPKILGKSLGLSDVAVLFSVTAGGAALGLFGVIVALPAAAVLKVLFLEFVEPALKQFADEDSATA